MLVAESVTIASSRCSVTEFATASGPRAGCAARSISSLDSQRSEDRKRVVGMLGHEGGEREQRLELPHHVEPFGNAHARRATARPRSRTPIASPTSGCPAGIANMTLCRDDSIATSRDSARISADAVPPRRGDARLKLRQGWRDERLALDRLEQLGQQLEVVRRFVDGLDDLRHARLEPWRRRPSARSRTRRSDDHAGARRHPPHERVRGARDEKRQHETDRRCRAGVIGVADHRRSSSAWTATSQARRP